MARADTIANVSEGPVRVNCRLQQRCTVDLPVGADPAWPGLHASSGPPSGTCRGNYRPRFLPPLERFSQSHLQDSPPPEERPKDLGLPSGPLNHLPGDDGLMGPASAFSPGQSDPCPHGHRGPLPDLLPRTEDPHPPAQDGAHEQSIRVAIQLRTIGDQFHASAVREHGAPYWPDVEDACRGLLNFLTQTLSALCRLM